MNWKRKTDGRIILDQYNIHFPSSFYNAFFILFDELDDEKEILEFIEKINKLMEKKKGSGYIITFEEIIYHRRVNTYVTTVDYYPKNVHHVIPTSRIKRQRGYKKEEISLPVIFHEAWHICFANLYGKEIIYLMNRFFKELINKRRELFYTCLDQTQKKIRKHKLTS